MTKSKLKKKKEREREVRKKILARREVKRRQEKENAKLDAEERALRPKQVPINNKEYQKAKQLYEQEMNAEIEQNLQLLEGLQEEVKKREEYVSSLKENVTESYENTTEKAGGNLEEIYEKFKIK